MTDSGTRDRSPVSVGRNVAAALLMGVWTVICSLVLDGDWPAHDAPGWIVFAACFGLAAIVFIVIDVAIAARRSDSEPGGSA